MQEIFSPEMEEFLFSIVCFHLWDVCKSKRFLLIFMEISSTWYFTNSIKQLSTQEKEVFIKVISTFKQF